MILGVSLLAVLTAGLSILLLKGCSGKKEPGSPDPSRPAETSEAFSSSARNPGMDYSEFFGHKAAVNENAPLYVRKDGGFKEAGHLGTDVLLDIAQEQDGAYVAVSDSDFWVRGSDLSASSRWFARDSRLLKQNRTITTKDSYRIQDEAGNVIARIQESHEYPVYVSATDTEPYGIRFMNGIFFIPAEDVASLAETTEEVPENAREIPVLMYHFFYSEADGGQRVDGNYVEVNELASHLNYLKENGRDALTMREVQYWMEKRASVAPGCVAITIDDADPSVHQYAMPVFTEYGMHATNFVICGWQPPEMPYELWEMRENGMELQSHGFLTHTGGCSGMGHGGLLLCMDHDAGVQDTIQSFDYVDGGFVYCYPFGDINTNAESIVRDGGAKLAFTTEPGKIRPDMDPLALPRVRVTGGNSLSAFAASIG